MYKNKVDFLLFGIELKLSIKDCLKRLFPLVLFFIPPLFIGGIDLIMILMYSILVILCIMVTWNKFDEDWNIRGYNRFLVEGVHLVSFAILCFVSGGKILSIIILPQYHIWIYLVILVLAGTVCMVYVWVVHCMIKSKAYSKVQKTQGIFPFSLAGLGGIVFAKNFIELSTDEDIFKVLSICYFTIGSIMIMGVIMLYKYYLIKNDDKLIEKAEFKLVQLNLVKSKNKK